MVQHGATSLPSTIFLFACILVLGMVTMFVFEHNNYMQYWHKRLEIAASKRPQYNANTDRHLHQNGFNKNETKRPRILCWIPTSPASLEGRAKSVKDTWGKRCDMLLFFSSKADSSFPAIGLNVEEGRDSLFNKTRLSLEYIYQRHINDADWFFKADDDTYVIMENLRHFLSKLNPSDPHYIGRMYTKGGGYNTGGAGYVFSRETLRIFKKALDEGGCPPGGGEDIFVAKCLKSQSVKPVSTRDSSGRETFFQRALQLSTGSPPHDFLSKYTFPLPYKIGPECCSDYPNTFHKVKPEMMYLLEYLIYRVKVET